MCGLLVAARGFRFPDQGLNPGLLRWEREVLTTVLPGKHLSLLRTRDAIGVILTLQESFSFPRSFT